MASACFQVSPLKALPWHDNGCTHLTSHSPLLGPHSCSGSQAGVGTYQRTHFSDGSIYAGPKRGRDAPKFAQEVVGWAGT